MTESDEAKENVAKFLGNAKGIMLDRMDKTLREIDNLRWWELWKCRRMARKCLGIGEFWDQGFKT